MNALLSKLSQRARWSVALPGLMLLVGLVVGGVHHHEGGDTHACAVCAASHAPATTAVAITALAAPVPRREGIVLPAVDICPSRTPHEHFGRAPPLS
jgi:hypothetical protein